MRSMNLLMSLAFVLGCAGEQEETSASTAELSASFPAVSATDAPVTSPEPSASPINVVITNGQGQVESLQVPGDQDPDTTARAILGMPSKVEEDKAKVYVNREEIPDPATIKCRYVARWNVPAYYDSEGKFWNGVSYDAAVVPVLEETSTGMVKTLNQVRGEPHKYVVTYFPKEALTANPKHTNFEVNGNSYAEVPPLVPEYCQPKARRKASKKG